MRLADNETVLDQLPDVLSAVGGTDFGSFVGVKPDLLLAAFQYGRSQAENKCVEKQVRISLSTCVATLGLDQIVKYADALSAIAWAITCIHSENLRY